MGGGQGHLTLTRSTSTPTLTLYALMILVHFFSDFFLGICTRNLENIFIKIVSFLSLHTSSEHT